MQNSIVCRVSSMIRLFNKVLIEAFIGADTSISLVDVRRKSDQYCAWLLWIISELKYGKAVGMNYLGISSAILLWLLSLIV